MKRTIILILILLTISFLPRIWMLTNFPPLIVDEPAYLRDINSMILNKNYYPANFQWDGSQATISYLPTIFLIKTFSLNGLFTLRLISVIFSLLTLIPFFFLTKKYTNEFIAFITTLMFSFSYYFLQFSRVGWGVIYPVTLGLYAFWLIDSLNKKNDYLKIIVSSILTGLIFYMYRAGEIYIVGAFLFFFTKIIKKQITWQKKALPLSLFIICFLIVILPWLIKINSNPTFYTLRQKVVSITNTQLPYHGLYKTSDIFLYQAQASLKAWVFMLPVNNPKSSEDSRYLPTDYTAINPLLIPLFIGGLIWAIKKFKIMFVWIIIYALGIIVGQLLTIDPPNGARGLILLPIIYIFSALSLKLIYDRYKNNKKLIPLLLAFSVIISIMDFIFYRNWMTWIKV